MVAQPQPNALGVPTYNRGVRIFSHKWMVPYLLRQVASTGVAAHLIVKQIAENEAANRARYESRIAELSKYCEEDSIILNNGSINHFRQFLSVLAGAASVGIVATHTGNLRAVWRKEGSRFAVEFFEDGSCEYVMWSTMIAPQSAYCTIQKAVSLFHDIIDAIREQ